MVFLVVVSFKPKDVIQGGQSFHNVWTFVQHHTLGPATAHCLAP
jgi:hypothetical protein